jgi:hypothetical protein
MEARGSVVTTLKARDKVSDFIIRLRKTASVLWASLPRITCPS